MTERADHCIDPADIDRNQLVAFAAGEPVLQVANHLGRCPACRRDAAAYAETAGTLKRTLFRLSCPTSTTLGEYTLGILEPIQMMAVAEHLLDCPWCKAETTSFATFLKEADEVEDRGVLARLRRLVLRPLPQAAAASLRSPTAPTTITYEAGNVRITIGIQEPSLGQRGRVIAGLAESGAAPPGGIASLYEGQRQVTVGQVDEFGNFLFENVAAGTYRLEVAIGADIAVIDGVTVP